MGTPFCSISAAVKKAAAGDLIQVEAGEYHEQVVPLAGVNVHATSKSAVVAGTDDLSTAVWAPEAAATTWSTVVGVNAQPASAYSGGVVLTKAASVAAMGARSWFYESPTRKLYVDLGATSAPTSADAVTIARSYGIRVKSGSAVDGFTVRDQAVAGIQFDQADGGLVSNMDVTGSRAYGINVLGGSNNTVTGVHASGNTSIGIRLSDTVNGSVLSSESDHNGNHGVSVQGGSGNRVALVNAHDNVSAPGQPRIATGIDVNKSAIGPSAGAVVEQNTVWNNGDSGIEIYQGSANATVRRNVSFDNGDHGIDISVAPNAVVVSNTVVGNATPGINVEGGSTGVRVRDNIAVDNAVNSTGTHGDIRVDAASVSGTSLDRDLVFQSNGTGTLVEWAAVDYKSLADLRTAQPAQEPQGMSAAPGFVSLSGRDLALTIGSPAVDAADASVPGWLAADRLGKSPVDQPTVVDTGLGNPTYADLGALELTTVTEPPPPSGQPPTAQLDATPSSPFVGQPVTLDASRSTDDFGVTGYAFDCGNGTTVPAGPASSATCVYASQGTYTASVTVSDAANQLGRQTAKITVDVAKKPKASLDVSPGSVVVGGPVILDGSKSKEGIATYTFDCGNGTAVVSGSSSSTTCVYNREGKYTASLTVTNFSNASDTDTKNIDVKVAKAPKASLDVSPGSVVVGGPVTLDGSKSKDGITQYWFDCGNGTAAVSGSSSSTTCVYNREGKYTASVKVTNSSGQFDTDTKTIDVKVAKAPKASLDVSPGSPLVGELVTLDGSKSKDGITQYWFDCGNGTAVMTGSSSSTTCVYRTAGKYTASVRVTNSSGEFDTTTKNVDVKAPK